MKPRQEEIREFLHSRRGLAYFIMKYPKLSVADAIREYEISASN